MRSISPRATRLIDGITSRLRAITVLRTLGPSRAATNSSSTIEGIAISASMMRWSTESIQVPPK
jgi:hypothetical protein